MFCWNCGARIRDESRFCSHCGVDVRDVEAEAPPAEATGRFQTPAPAPEVPPAPLAPAWEHLPAYPQPVPLVSRPVAPDPRTLAEDETEIADPEAVEDGLPFPFRRGEWRRRRKRPAPWSRILELVLSPRPVSLVPFLIVIVVALVVGLWIGNSAQGGARP